MRGSKARSTSRASGKGWRRLEQDGPEIHFKKHKPFVKGLRVIEVVSFLDNSYFFIDPVLEALECHSKLKTC